MNDFSVSFDCFLGLADGSLDMGRIRSIGKGRIFFFLDDNLAMGAFDKVVILEGVVGIGIQPWGAMMSCFVVGCRGRRTNPFTEAILF